jgi:hypothetical protein
MKNRTQHRRSSAVHRASALMTWRGAPPIVIVTAQGTGHPDVFLRQESGPAVLLQLRRGLSCRPTGRSWESRSIGNHSCIPHNFNLLVQFNPPTAFGCTLTIEGKRWWHDPATDPFPFQIRYSGLGRFQSISSMRRSSPLQL